jgi:NADPH:quinone reductase-like Zn-dependent oxidoreductase
VRGLGADEVVDYETDRFEDRVDGVDVVLDAVGGSTQTRSWSVLRPGGVLVSVASPPDPEEAASHRARGRFFIVEPNRGQLETIAQLIDGGRLRPVVDRVLPLGDFGAAYEGLRTRRRRGKVVIHVAG